PRGESPQEVIAPGQAAFLRLRTAARLQVAMLLAGEEEGDVGLGPVTKERRTCRRSAPTPALWLFAIILAEQRRHEKPGRGRHAGQRQKQCCQLHGQSPAGAARTG